MLRLANQDDLPFLKWMLYEASYIDPENRPPFDRGLREPGTAVYLEGWVRPGDAGLIAVDGRAIPLGAAWYRLFAAGAPGYGFIDEQTPELAIAVRPDVRGQGLGGKLMTALLQLAGRQGHRQISLAVEPANAGAHRLYQRLGFVEIGRDEEVIKMVRPLAADAPGPAA